MLGETSRICGIILTTICKPSPLHRIFLPPTPSPNILGILYYLFSGPYTDFHIVSLYTAENQEECRYLRNKIPSRPRKTNQFHQYRLDWKHPDLFPHYLEHQNEISKEGSGGCSSKGWWLDYRL
jgi:hypothetical protein